MKRSEMIEQIAYLIKHGAYIGDKVTFEAYAEAILQRVEKKGMLPPPYVDESVLVMDVYNVSDKYKNEWEKE